MQTEYHGALLHLRMQTRCFAEAFMQAAQAARALPTEDAPVDPLAQRVMVEVAATLQAACERIPGAAEVFALALSAQTKES